MPACQHRSDSTISNNQSDNNGVGINLYSANRTLIEQNVISDNSTNGAGDTGGAMYILYGESNALVNSTVSNNYAGDGGGVYLQSTNNMSIVGSTINANSVASRGGGVFAYNSNNLNIVNSTISANSAPTADGGGIYWDDNSAFGSIVQSSIVDNLANEGGGIYALRSIDLSNNVFASNVSNASSNNDCNGSVVGTDVGNWVSDGSCNGSAASGDPKLGSLEDNGGLTLTHAPKAGSGLRKAGDVAVCTNLLVNGVDQRGEARGETECTIGAVEYIDDGSFFVVPLPGGKAVIFGI